MPPTPSQRCERPASRRYSSRTRPRRPRRALVAKLARFGIPAGTEDLLTPPVAAAARIRSRGAGLAALFVPDATREEFRGLETVDATAPADLAYVVIGDLGAAWNYATLNRAFRLLHECPRRELVALGMTRYWQSPDSANPDVAPFVAALECAAGRRAVVLGKPARDFFVQASQILGVAPGDLLMVGDDLRADALGTQRAGLRSALVRTGKFRSADLDSPDRPHWVLDSVRDLPSLLAESGVGRAS